MRKKSYGKLVCETEVCGIEPAEIELCNRVAEEIFGEKPNFEFVKYRER